jgi:hypothetical protein
VSRPNFCGLYGVFALLIPGVKSLTIDMRASAQTGKGRAVRRFPAAHTHCGPPVRVHLAEIVLVGEPVRTK